mgnify:FL=1
MKSKLLRKYTELKFERPAMQTLSEIVYQQDAKMGETKHATLTDCSSADKPSQPTSPTFEPKNSGTLPILEVGEGSL